MVRRGSTVRVRQRALQKSLKSASFRSKKLARAPVDPSFADRSCRDPGPRAASARRSSGRSQGCRCLGGSEAPAHRLVDPGCDVRLLLLQPAEVAPEHDEELCRRGGRDRGAATRAGEHGDLSEEVAWPEISKRGTVGRHDRAALREDEERIAARALTTDAYTLVRSPVGEPRRDLFELGLLERLE